MKKMLLIFFVLTLLKIEAACPPHITVLTTDYIVKKCEEPLRQLIFADKVRYTLKLQESGNNYFIAGGSGEIGAYQMMPKTYMKYCKRYFGEYRAPTPHNQDTLAFCAIKDLVTAGYNLSQIASIWNSGYPNSTKKGVNFAGVAFDVEAYVRSFNANFQKVEKLYIENPTRYNLFFYARTNVLIRNI